MMLSLDIKIMVCLTVENNYCSRFIPNVITAMLSIVKLLSCNTHIGDVESQIPDFKRVQVAPEILREFRLYINVIHSQASFM